MITFDFRKIPLRPGHKILDVGCGSGRHLAEAARYENITAYGVDLGVPDLVQARARLEFHEKVGATGGGPWALIQADVTCLPFPAAYFDVVICSEVLEHIPDHLAAISELVRVLKPGGDLLVSVPRFFPERVCWALSPDYYQANGGHVRIYRAGQLIYLLESAGVNVWATHYAHGLHSFYWWLKCLTGPTRTDNPLINLYHELLVWDMMKHPRPTRLLERLLNPVIGKSLVYYAKKIGRKQK